MSQLNLFDQREEKEAPPQQVVQHNTLDFDYLHSKLELMNRRAQEDLDMVKGLIAELQADWTEDEKLQINDPKEWQRQQILKNQEEQKQQVMKETSSAAIEVLQKCTVEGTTVKLPESQLDRKIYLEVKNYLELIGGKWKGGKTMGFVFQEDPTELLEQIANGEKRNLKKEYQYFATPDKLADRLIELAELELDSHVLEPSAGQGAIVKAINRKFPKLLVHCYEAMPTNITILKKIPTVEFIGEDFLESKGYTFDTIIANPPFSKNQDIEHIRKMYSCLNTGGRIVSIASNHWQMSSNKTETLFKNWLAELGAKTYEIDPGEFKESGTMVGGCIIVIDKP